MTCRSRGSHTRVTIIFISWFSACYRCRPSIAMCRDRVEPVLRQLALILASWQPRSIVSSCLDDDLLPMQQSIPRDLRCRMRWHLGSSHGWMVQDQMQEMVLPQMCACQLLARVAGAPKRRGCLGLDMRRVLAARYASSGGGRGAGGLCASCAFGGLGGACCILLCAVCQGVRDHLWLELQPHVGLTRCWLVWD